MDEYFHFLICLLEQNKFFMKDGTVHFLRNACVDVEDVDMSEAGTMSVLCRVTPSQEAAVPGAGQAETNQ